MKHYDYYKDERHARRHEDDDELVGHGDNDSYLGTLCIFHAHEREDGSSQARELDYYGTAPRVRCQNPFCFAECCVCVAM